MNVNLQSFKCNALKIWNLVKCNACKICNLLNVMHVKFAIF